MGTQNHKLEITYHLNEMLKVTLWDLHPLSQTANDLDKIEKRKEVFILLSFCVSLERLDGKNPGRDRMSEIEESFIIDYNDV